MSKDANDVLIDVVNEERSAILNEWLQLLAAVPGSATGRISLAEIRTQADEVLHLLQQGLASGEADRHVDAFAPLRDRLAEISRSRAMQGFSPTDVATFVFSLKEPIFNALGRRHGGDPAAISAGIWAATKLIDQVGLHTMEVFLSSREETIGRQAIELSELSTPVVRLWDGILALPLIGTLDSVRAGVVMETLLEAIVENAAEIAIIDITGVPTVDTMVAQHLIKTISSARLMGADCIVSGIRPQIAQTMVHLGVELNVVSKATLADAFAVALRRTGRTVAAAASKAG